MKKPAACGVGLQVGTDLGFIERFALDLTGISCDKTSSPFPASHLICPQHAVFNTGHTFSEYIQQSKRAPKTLKTQHLPPLRCQNRSLKLSREAEGKLIKKNVDFSSGL